MKKKNRINFESNELAFVEKNDNPTVFYKGNLFTGLVFYLDEANRLSREEQYVDGKLNGVVKDYYENGVLESECYRIGNTFSGSCKRYNRGGKLISHIIFDSTGNKHVINIQDSAQGFFVRTKKYFSELVTIVGLKSISHTT